MFATASAGAAWLMLELCGPWGSSAFLESPTVIDPALGLSIVRRAEAASMRIVAVRKHGRRDQTRRWRWFIAHTSPDGPTLVGGEVDGPAAYLDIPLDGSTGEPVPAPFIAVCAHGKHDTCCAVRGRGVAAALHAEYPDETWECSHLGGDRFAATMLVLPEGLSYGRVDSADPLEIMRKHREGRVDTTHLRGRTCWSHHVQAAQHFARQDTGDDRIDAWAPLEIQVEETLARVTLDGGDGRRLVVTVRSYLSEDTVLTMCRATLPGSVRRFECASMDWA
ncbi:sucrase ferredoxin [Williamsia deligens]|uniref:Sucrase ferredoxin n=1 Tax=Williamsia deligens TaxID=321325 RepID=A0ABW3G774_9NOCA|nr:sucrase ferredoxin [Williamsia deligens]MCP2193199.1 Sucrase/ferredoxin-like [Williamsia deligens]